MNEIFDVAVVGAGPAGSSCALTLAQMGLKNLVLIDQEIFPRDKACGDGIGPGAVQLMRKLGIQSSLRDHVPIKYLSVSGPHGTRATGVLPPVAGSVPVGYTIPRSIFDNYIFDAAIKAGAVNQSGHQVQQVEWIGDQWKIDLKESAGGQQRTIYTKVLVGADGARSKVRRALGIPFNSDRHTGTAARIYAEAKNSEFEALQIDLKRSLLPAYGWLFPISKTKANIGVGIDLDNYKKNSRHLEKLLSSYRQELGSSIEFDEQSYKAYILPYGSELPRLAHPQKSAAIIGDAGSMINPLTGEGIFYAMWAGELLGRLLAETQTKNDKLVSAKYALESFERQFREKFKSHYDINWRMKKKVENPIWCDMVIKACKKDSKVLSNLIDLMMGDKKNLDPSMSMRIFARNFLPFF